MGTLNLSGAEPEIVSYLEQDGTATVLIFCVADDGRLYLRPNISLHTDWMDLGIIPSGAPAAGIPAGVTYVDQGGRQIRVFFRSEDGHLNVAWLQGNQWLMQDQGTPPGTKIVDNPVAVTYFFEQHIQHVYCFAQGEDGQLYLNKWDGRWSWVRVGAPAGIKLEGLEGSMSAVSFFDEQNQPAVYVFATPSLFSTTETVGWPWMDHGEPAPSIAIAGDMAAVGYLDLGTKKSRLYAFVGAENDNNLYVRWYDGNNWHWGNQGRPVAPVGFEPSLGAVHYIHQTTGRLGTFYTDVIYVFTPDGNSDLSVNWWDGKNWNWSSLGRPGVSPGNPGLPVIGKPRPAAFYEMSNRERVFAAVRGVDGNLYMAWWNDQEPGWDWLALGSPKLSTLVEHERHAGHRRDGG